MLIPIASWCGLNEFEPRACKLLCQSYIDLLLIDFQAKSDQRLTILGWHSDESEHCE